MCCDGHSGGSNGVDGVGSRGGASGRGGAGGRDAGDDMSFVMVMLVVEAFVVHAAIKVN